MIKAILFDMDGTLLPMDLNIFIKRYFKALGVYLAKYGVDGEVLNRSMFCGVKAMIANDGQKSNKEVFWDAFIKVSGFDYDDIFKKTDPFYTDEFDNLKIYTEPNPLARTAIEVAHREGRRVVLATNPLFPMSAQVTRARWIGLTPEDFEFITSYESDSYCKPNPKYYLSICERLGLTPEECLMIGNDESDDIKAAEAAGLNCYLITDWLISCEGYKRSCPTGSFSDMIEYLKNLK